MDGVCLEHSRRVHIPSGLALQRSTLPMEASNVETNIRYYYYLRRIAQREGASREQRFKPNDDGHTTG